MQLSTEENVLLNLFMKNYRLSQDPLDQICTHSDAYTMVIPKIDM